MSDKNENLAAKLHKNIGFGIGFMFREGGCLITAANSKLIEPGMAFHIKLVLGGLDAKEDKSVVAMGDTIIVKHDGTV